MHGWCRWAWWRGLVGYWVSLLCVHYLFQRTHHYFSFSSTSGFVNVYGADSFSPDSDLSSNPKPIKSIANLVTPISTLRFNHDAQLLAIASQEKKDAMRLVRAFVCFFPFRPDTIF